MNRRHPSLRVVLSTAMVSILLCGTVSCGNEGPAMSQGVVDDWTSRHVIFSNPGTEEEAYRQGTHDRWLRIMQDPRYRMQQVRLGNSAEGGFPNRLPARPRRRPVFEQGSSDYSNGSWAVTLSATAAGGVADGMFPAKYTFSPIQAPSCANDYVVYPINTAGVSGSQANIVGINNLYTTTCGNTVGTNVATVKFAYYVGTGTVATSPSLSLDGTKIAFVESRATGGSILHVLTLGTTGSNGTAYNHPAVAGTGNNASMVNITLSGSTTATTSSPFIDYSDDIAYVGDDSPRLHKITGVFNGTPKEVTTSPWPITVDAAGNRLTGPVYDFTSQHIFVGERNVTSGLNGVLRCYLPAGNACPIASATLGAGLIDPPIVDSTNETVFEVANATLGSTGEVFQYSASNLTKLAATPVGGAFNLPHQGAFDNNYITKGPASGFYYMCGEGSGTTTTSPTLVRIGFNSSGVMNSSTDSNSIALTTGTLPTSSFGVCTAISEIYNPTGGTSGTGQDLIFLSVQNKGFTSPTASNGTNCNNTACIMAFDITSGFPTKAWAAAFWAVPPGLGSYEASGIVVDGVSSTTGASQIYFGNQALLTANQLSQALLQ